MNRKIRRDGVVKSRLVVMASQMPPLKHWPDRSKPFVIRESEVCQWFMGQDQMWEWLIQKVRDMGIIVYDEQNRVWVGCDTELGRKLAGQGLPG